MGAVDSNKLEPLIEKCINELDNLPYHKDTVQQKPWEYFPPLMNPERLSLWICEHILHPSDLNQRLAWTYCQDTYERIEFIVNEAIPESRSMVLSGSDDDYREPNIFKG